MCRTDGGRKDGASGGGGRATLPTVERLCTRLKGFSLDFISHPITWYTRGRERERSAGEGVKMRGKKIERKKEGRGDIAAQRERGHGVKIY